MNSPCRMDAAREQEGAMGSHTGRSCWMALFAVTVVLVSPLRREAFASAVGRQYQLRLWLLDSDATGTNWGAWITDTVTQAGSFIGEIHLANSNGYTGYGWLVPYNIFTFLEYFSGSTCAQVVNYAKVY